MTPAMAAGGTFTVYLTPPEGVKDVTGKVLSVELIEGAVPLKYGIVMKVKGLSSGNGDGLRRG